MLAENFIRDVMDSKSGSDTFPKSVGYVKSDHVGFEIFEAQYVGFAGTFCTHVQGHWVKQTGNIGLNMADCQSDYSLQAFESTVTNHDVNYPLLVCL